MKKIFVLLLLCLMLVSCFKKGNKDAKTGATVKKEEKKLIPGDNYTILGKIDGLNGWVIEYDNDFVRGGDILTEEGIQKLYELGVKTVFSVTPTEIERELTNKYNMKLIEMPYEKDPGLTSEILLQFFKDKNSNPGKYYVHCIGGADRAGALVAANRILKESWDYKKALKEFRNLGGHDKKYPELLRILREGS